LLEGGGVISVQVLNEFVNVSRRKQGRGWDEVHDALGVLKILLETMARLRLGQIRHLDSGFPGDTIVECHLLSFAMQTPSAQRPARL